MRTNDYLYDNYRLAEFYESIYGHIKEDFPVWLKGVEGATNVLELAAGSGRVTLELAKQQNANIVALDYSREMLGILDNKIREGGIGNISTIQGDMRSFDLGRKFDSILITSNSLNHIEKNEDLTKCFNTMMDHLEDDGVLVFDILNPLPSFLVRDMEREYDHRIFENKLNGKRFKMWENSSYNRAEQINYVNYFYQYVDGNELPVGEVIKATIKVRLFYPQEMDMFLNMSGYKFEKYGWYDFSEFTGVGPAQIYFVRKE